MAEYRTERTVSGDDVVVERRRGGGGLIAGLIIAALLIVGLLFLTGFWKVNATGGSMPKVNVQGGSLPKVDVKSDKIVVGTKSTTIDVPKVETKKAEVKVPVVGVKDENGDGK